MSTALENGVAAARTRRPRVLLVEDHEIGRRSLCRLLDALGYDVTTANDGESAVETLRSVTRFDYLLTDVRLPDLDGREVVRAARGLDPSPQIALITGWDLDPEERGALGVDWIFLKPLDVQAIVATLRRSPPSS